MKTFEKILMFMTVLASLVSISLFYDKGFTNYCWQVNTIIWVGVAFLKGLQINRLEKTNGNK